MSPVAARVNGRPVPVTEVDRREARLRAATSAALPRPHTSEGRQLRRWLTQVIVTERVIAAEAAARGITAEAAPAIDAVLPDPCARAEVGSITAAALDGPLARALFAHVTADVTVDGADVAGYHARHPMRFAPVRPAPGGWREPPAPPALPEAREAILAHLTGAARRRAFSAWLDTRRAELVELAPGFEHPGDPRQPDNTHRH